MSTLIRSSGDFHVDRQYDFVELLLAEKDFHAAFDLLQSLVDRVPNWAWGWYKLGEVAHVLGRMDVAQTSWERVIALDDTDPYGAGAMLNLMGVRDDDQMPAHFIETLFDQYADSFDTSLVQKLEYTVPERLGVAVSELHPDRFKATLDLGCGTGLAGAVFRPVSDHLSGVDLSQGMLRQAQKRGIYDTLSKADVLQLPLLDRPVFDLVIAADVFIYLGALDTTVAWVFAALQENGIFAFTVESTQDHDAFALRPTRRYAHSRHYVENVLFHSGFAILTLTETVLRKDRGEDVLGYLVIAQKPEAIRDHTDGIDTFTPTIRPTRRSI